MGRIITIEDGEHSPLGPSSSERWLNCPGSVLATMDVPHTPSRFAAEGTAAHTVSQWCREQNVKAEKFIGIKVRVPPDFEFTIDRQFADGVQEFIDYVDQYSGDAGYELRVNYTRWVKNGFGTLDDARLSDRFCAVTDLKFGKGVQVFAKDNPQLKLYALGLYHDFSHLYEFKDFMLTVHQPRLDHVDEWKTNIDDLLHWVETEVKPIAEIALKPGAPFKAGKGGGEWCQFCKIKFTCETRTKAVYASVIGEFENLDEAIDQTLVLEDTPYRSQTIELLTNDKLSRIGETIAAIKAWCKDIQAVMMRKIQHGEKIGDWKLVAGRSRRKWNGSDDLIAALLEEEGVDDATIWSKKIISPPKAEKIIGKKHVIMTEYVDKPPGKPVLVSGDDRRPPLSANALQEFEDLGEEEEEEEDWE